LPNLQGRTPIGAGSVINMGQAGGEAMHTLTRLEVPAHTHALNAVSGANSPRAAGSLPAGGGANLFTGAAALAAMSPGTLNMQGGNQPHENRQPYLVMNWCIALVGIFPSRN
jgi:microcystin-dependent protein